MLACMATLVSAHVQGLIVHPEEQLVVPSLAKAYTRDDYSAVCRFESHGGGEFLLILNTIEVCNK